MSRHFPPLVEGRSQAWTGGASSAATYFCRFVLIWEGFKFPDGAEANKFFVIVGAQPGNYLAIIATSQQKKRGSQPGGNPERGYYLIPGGKKD